MLFLRVGLHFNLSWEFVQLNVIGLNEQKIFLETISLYFISLITLPVHFYSFLALLKKLRMLQNLYIKLGFNTWCTSLGKQYSIHTSFPWLAKSMSVRYWLQSSHTRKVRFSPGSCGLGSGPSSITRPFWSSMPSISHPRTYVRPTCGTNGSLWLYLVPGSAYFFLFYSSQTEKLIFMNRHTSLSTTANIKIILWIYKKHPHLQT
jgi:hypothetical protein